MLRKFTSAAVILTFLLALEPFVNTSGLPVSARLSLEPDKPLVTVIVNSSIFTAIETSLDQYKTDVELAGFSVDITQTGQMPNATPEEIRSYLQQAYSQDLGGVLFVGDVPTAWFKVGDTSFPTDMFYRDLNGAWTDVDHDGIYEEHGGDTSPEIWAGRLKPPTVIGDETSLLNNYFTKNHRFRKGLRVLPWWRTLAYIDDDGVDWAQDVNSSLKKVSSDITLVTDPVVTSAEDYLNRLRDPFGFEWVYLMCHGAFDYHGFQIDGQPTGGTVYPHEYRFIDPRVFFYLMFVCQAARFTEQDYLAGSTVFTDTYGLLSISSTETIYSVSFQKFFTILAEGKSIGTAFQDWYHEEDGLHGQPLNEHDYQLVFYGLTIIGDPTLKPYIRREVKLHDISIVDVSAHVIGEGSQKNLNVTILIQNPGDFDESIHLSVTMYAHILAASQTTLKAKSVTAINLIVKEPYHVALANHSRAPIATALSPVMEEFNLGDNLKQINLDGVSIIPPVTSYNLNRWEWLVLTLAIIILLPYGVFRALTSDRLSVLEYLKKLKNALMKKRR